MCGFHSGRCAARSCENPNSRQGRNWSIKSVFLYPTTVCESNRTSANIAKVSAANTPAGRSICQIGGRSNCVEAEGEVMNRLVLILSPDAHRKRAEFDCGFVREEDKIHDHFVIGAENGSTAQCWIWF